MLECKYFAVNNWRLGHEVVAKYRVPTLEIFCQAIIAAVFGWCLFVGLSVFIFLLQHKRVTQFHWQPYVTVALGKATKLLWPCAMNLWSCCLWNCCLEDEKMVSAAIFKATLVCQDGNKMLGQWDRVSLLLVWTKLDHAICDKLVKITKLLSFIHTEIHINYIHLESREAHTFMTEL